MKEEILNKIKDSRINPATGYNSMGARESLYDPYFMISECFTEEELQNMSESELNNLIKLEEFHLNIVMQFFSEQFLASFHIVLPL